MLLDFIFPRFCLVCGKRLKKDENLVCLHCNIHLPRTDHFSHLEDNPVKQYFVSEERIIRAASFMYHRSGTDSANIVYSMKYHDNRKGCRKMGRLIAYEAKESGFFDDIDIIIPIPLTLSREHRRGYNQCYHIAKGISDVTGLPVLRHILLRNTFQESQTHLSLHQRIENVVGAFTLRDAETIRGKHILIVDDVITTGATTMYSARELLKAEGTTVSIISLAYAGQK